MRPSRAKKRQFFALFFHFRIFLNLEIFLVDEFCWFFNMTFLGIFRSDFQKWWKKGQNLAFFGQKQYFFVIFAVFQGMNFSNFLIWCFRAYLEVNCKKWWKRVTIRPSRAKNGHFLALFLPTYADFWTYHFFLVNEFFWFFIWCF